jgi:glycoprotein 3-alpha-L-fucosyltransferase
VLQIWILYFLECPYHTQHIKYNDVFNWTATYRRDSDLVAPYERWAYYDPRVKQRPLTEMPNYAVNKTRKVSLFLFLSPLNTNHRLVLCALTTTPKVKNTKTA